TTIASTPTGLSVTVDGGTYTTPATFNWSSGSVHSVSVISPQIGGADSYYYASWSDNASQSRSISASAATTLFLVNFTLTPNSGCTLTPGQGVAGKAKFTRK